MKRLLLRLILNCHERAVLKDGLHERYGAYLRKLDLPSNRGIQDEIEAELTYTVQLQNRLLPDE